MDVEENQNQVSLHVHSPWKSQKARFPHSHRPDDEARGKVEIQKQDFHFPTGSVSSLLLTSKNQRKEAWRPGPSLPPPRAFFHEEILPRPAPPCASPLRHQLPPPPHGPP